MNQHASINRRDFLGTAAGLTLALTILPEPFAGIDEAMRGRTVVAECLAHHRARRHHHHRVAGGRDGAGHLHHRSGHHRRRARCRLVEGQADPAASLGREEIRQSGIRHDLPDLGQRLGARLLQAGAARGRAGAARAARGGGGEMERAGRRAFDRAERGGAQGVRPAHQLRRDRGLRARLRPSCPRSTRRISRTRRASA